MKQALVINEIFKKLTKKKEELDKYRPLPPELVKNIQEWLDVEYTYTSNWIEGNTLDRSETALVLEKGITVEGKSLREHLEAINHLKAIDFIRSLIKKGHQFITENDIRDIHKIILTGIDDRWAGVYRQTQVFIKGAAVEPPPANEVPYRMKKLIEWLQGEQGAHPVKIAADLHYRFVVIHPFLDGNGRTGRLLMNLVLMQAGFPIAIIKIDEREAYIEAIKQGTVTGEKGDFYSLIISAVDRSLDAYLAAAKGRSIIPFFIEKAEVSARNLLHIGKIASLANVAIPTVRYYIAEGLIKPDSKSKGGFMLFSPKVVERIKEIKRLQKVERLKIAEIRKRIT